MHAAETKWLTLTSGYYIVAVCLNSLSSRNKVVQESACTLVYMPEKFALLFILV